MAVSDNPFLSRPFLRSVWNVDYQLFCDSPDEKALIARLEAWSKRRATKETTSEGTFLSEFFEKTWGFRGSGQPGPDEGYTLHPRFSIRGSGQGGGTGEADLALGWFGRTDVPEVPQVLCEFKGIRSSLDAPQRRKGNDRSPVKQCLDYLSASRRALFGNEPILPTWAIVTNMDEFRLYWFDRAPQQFLRFKISSQGELFGSTPLLAAGEEARFERFLFWKIFQVDTLISTAGRSPLALLIGRQWVSERKLEDQFYDEYRALRERLYRTLVISNPAFSGTRGQLVRLAQKLLDRIIFVAFCEDMGRALSYPPKLFRDFLGHASKDPYFDPNGSDVWTKVRGLFAAMNEGRVFGEHRIQMFNGGLFATDPQLDSLSIPNDIFCHRNQGQSEATLYANKQTVLYIVGAYNFASEVGKEQSIGLYTLGHIFEQSTTELEILEAEAEDRPSLNKITKRKREGVYYTPEWVVERIVRETVGARLEQLRTAAGWKDERAADLEAVTKHEAALAKFRICDPACGSGAFLIVAVKVLVDEFKLVTFERARLSGTQPIASDAILIKSILSNNIYGVDINPASIEITKLALWLHTARDKEPLRKV